MSEFVHLHLHSEYSLLDSTCRVSDIVLAAVNNRQKAVAITDHGVMYGAVKFFNECKKAGIKPIIGCEISVLSNERFDVSVPDDKRPYHLVVLVKDDIGYKNLCCIVSNSYSAGLRFAQSIDVNFLRDHHDGLIALSGCTKGVVSQYILKGDIDAAKKAACELNEIFGEDNFYLELQNHGFEEQKVVNNILKEISSDVGIPLVATNNVHYINPEDADAQSVAMHIKTNTSAGDGRQHGFESDELYFKSSDEMCELFGGYDHATENTLKISDRCNFEFDFSEIHIPRYTPNDGSSPKDFLKKLAFEGLRRRIDNGQLIYSDIHTEDEYISRINYELFIIDRMGYDEYFLVVWDFVNYAKNNFIPTGPGRGSGAGSLVAFLIGITDIDSVKYELLFERFLNPQRVSMPDFDIDFGDEKRDDVIKYVSEKYGSEHVAQIVTFGTLSARAVLHDVGRALKTDDNYLNSVIKALPQKISTSFTLHSALETEELRKLYEKNHEIKKLIDVSLKLEGIPRHSSVHAAGIVITELPVSSYLPVTSDEGMIVTQYDMDSVAKLGLLKFDFLALRNLTIISDTEKFIKENDPEFDITKIPLDDSEAFQLISSGRTEGVFQLESDGMKEMLATMKPSSIDDIMLAIALYRPGPMESIPKFLEIRSSGRTPEYDIPILSEILDTTYGCIIYQEQVMLILRKVAGYSFGQADIVRRAMSKKNSDAMENERIDFVKGAVSNGINAEKADKLFSEIARFASYAFNKSHAAAYALISYRTAWLKAKYPKEYMAALLTSVVDNSEKMMRYISDCARFNINVIPPDVNESEFNFSVSADGIRFGIAAVKNVGNSLAKIISKERKKEKYRSLFDFIARLSGKVNKKQVECLIKSGACDCFNVERNAMLEVYEGLIDAEQRNNMANVSGQIGLFDEHDGETRTFEYPEVTPLTSEEKLIYEKESTGIYFSGHPLDSYTKAIEMLKSFTVSRLTFSEKISAHEISVSGVVIRKTVKSTKSGDPMVFVTIEDRYACCDVVLFSDCAARYGMCLDIGKAICVIGHLDSKSDELRIIADKIVLLKNDLTFVTSEAVDNHVVAHPDSAVLEDGNADERKRGIVKKVFFRLPDLSNEVYLKVVNLLKIYSTNDIPYNCIDAILYDSSTKKYVPFSESKVLMTDVLVSEVKNLIGKENIAFR